MRFGRHAVRLPGPGGPPRHSAGPRRCWQRPPAAAWQADTAPVAGHCPRNGSRWHSEGSRYPWFAKEQARTEATLKKMMKAGIDVPVPKDKGGGRTHEQHKRNYQALLAAGTLYRLTGDRAYVDYARDMLLQYARLYPTLGPHPEGRGQIPGRVFWQVLNDSVWLVNAIQGYDAIRDALSANDRDTIESKVFRPMAGFLASEPKNYDQIHNHATWAVAATGMTGYVLRDPELVEKSLRGSQKDDRFGFLRQIDLLFSPDGYYEEGPYYQRYALAPFLLFANAIERNEPQRKIFARRDGVLLKAVDALVQSSYGGLFFPINDAILDKGIDTEELVAGIGIAYARTGDDRLLSVAQQQKRLLLSPEGLQVAQALAANRARPFDYHPMLLRDGPDGDRGGLAILRMNGERGQALVQKDTLQGMGHGHFDKLNWLFYDNGNPVVTDYGAARFLNVEAKRGGIYLAENRSWAKQTVAHNTLVVDEQSHFQGDWKRGEAHAPQVRFFQADADTQVASASMRDAYPGVAFTRTQALLRHPDLGLPVVLDLLQVHGEKAARYDLPLHFNGHIVTTGFEAAHHSPPSARCWARTTATSTCGWTHAARPAANRVRWRGCWMGASTPTASAAARRHRRCWWRAARTIRSSTCAVSRPCCSAWMARRTSPSSACWNPMASTTAPPSTCTVRTAASRRSCAAAAATPK